MPELTEPVVAKHRSPLLAGVVTILKMGLWTQDELDDKLTPSEQHRLVRRDVLHDANPPKR